MSYNSSHIRNPAHDDEPDSEGSWAISYGDMVTLLLMFFILFFSVDKEQDRFRALEAALLAQLAPKQATASGEPYNLRVGDTKGDGIDPTTLAKWGGEVSKIGNKILIEFPNISFFKFGDTVVSKSGIEQLRQFVGNYTPYAGNYLLTIRAFTDTVPVYANGNKRFKDNLELSAVRAIAALRVIQKAGIPLGRMRAEGYGELKLSEEERKLALEQGKKEGDRGIKLARKVVLIIEPDVKDKLWR